MTQRIALPRLVGTREAADRLVEQLPADLHDDSVVLLGRALSTSTVSFADELVRALKERGTAEIVLLAAPEEFQRQVRDSASRRGSISVRLGDRNDLAAV